MNEMLTGAIHHEEKPVEPLLGFPLGKKAMVALNDVLTDFCKENSVIIDETPTFKLENPYQFELPIVSPSGQESRRERRARERKKKA